MWVVIGLIVAIAIVSALLSAIAVHAVAWQTLPKDVIETIGAALGLVLAAGVAFVLMWQLNPDPATPGAGPTPRGSLTLTAFALVFAIPIYLVVYYAITRKRSRQ